MTKVGDDVTREDYLTATELAVLTWIENHCKGKLGTQWHSLRRIGEDVNHAPSTVLRTVHSLERYGHIEITHGPGGAYGYEVLG